MCYKVLLFRTIVKLCNTDKDQKIVINEHFSLNAIR